MIKEGQELVSKGQSDVSKGDIAISEGLSKVAQGKQLHREAEQTYAQRFPGQPVCRLARHIDPLDRMIQAG